MNALEEVSLQAIPDAGVWMPMAWSQAITVILIAMAFFGLCAWFVHTPKKGALKMGRDTVKISSIIQDALDEAVDKKQISRKYANYWTSRIGKRAGIPDFWFKGRLGKKLGYRYVTQLKEQIKWRLNSWMHVRTTKDANGEAVETVTRKFYDKGVHTNIPGPLPGDDLRILNTKKEEHGIRRQKFSGHLKAA